MNNTVLLIGRISRNIELKKTGTGLSVCNITLAVTRNYKNANGEYETDFITCICFREIAERVAEYCKKGDLVGVRGTIQTQNYEKEGKKIYTTNIIVDKLIFLSMATKKVDSKKENSQEKKEEVKPDPYEQFSNEVEITDEQLPF